MNDIISAFSEQIREAISITEKIRMNVTDQKVSNVLFCGLGGSGIGGEIIAQLYADKLKVPVATTHDYDIPNFVGESTLVIASSYSGNTEETLSAVEKCRLRNAQIAVVTSGGKLLEEAESHGWTRVVIPAGEQPRAMLVYSIIQQIGFLSHYGLIPVNSLDLIKPVPELIDSKESRVQARAKELAQKLHNHTVVIYAGSQNEGLAVRFRQQLNENSKILCWHHVIPELTHNELVGWAGGHSQIAVVYLAADADHVRTRRRWEIVKDVILKYTSNISDITPEGANHIEQVFYLIHFTDWVSYYLSELKGVDSVEVDIISHLKSEMSKFD